MRIKSAAGFTLLELLVSVVVSAVVIMAVAGAVLFITQNLIESNREQKLQAAVDNLIHQIVDGVYDSGANLYGQSGRRGLRDAVAITGGSPQRVNFRDTFGNVRSFVYLQETGEVKYLSGTNAPQEVTIYPADLKDTDLAGSFLQLSFSFVSGGRTVTVTASLVYPANAMQPAGTANRVWSGSATTSVCLRNVN